MKTIALVVLPLVLLFAIEIGYFAIAKHFNIVDKPSKRGSSQSVVLRGGGIIFPIAAILLLAMSGFSEPLFVIGLTIVSALSFIDDIHSLSPKLRLPLQFVGMLLMLSQLAADSPELTTFGYIILFVAGLIVCTGAMNIFNFMDGINGITGGYSLIVLLFLALVWTRGIPGKASTTMVSLITITIYADIVFCFFNFRRKALCFAGDVGSVSVAFIILFILGTLMVQTQDVSYLAFLAVYGVDGCLTIVHRIMLHEHISLPHRKHAYQIMANELHMPHIVVSLIYMTLQALCCFIYIELPGYTTLIVEILILSAAYILFMRKFYHLHVESGNA